MALNWSKLSKKWQEKWDKDSVLQVEVNDFKQKKYFLTTPYPYMSGILHLGHLFTYMNPEVIARFKRMQGYNTLFKFAFHCTGTPIVAAAGRVKEGEPKQIETLKKMGIKQSEIKKFQDPEYWCEYFPQENLQDLKNIGFAIDDRYTFKTTYLDPAYDKFITWQFNKLKAGDYVKRGKHPVVWCPKDNVPVGDHDRSEGEGETPQEFTILKFLMDDGSYLCAATLRPETVYGQTNMWIDAEVEYVKIDIDGEIWIVSEDCANKLSNQGREITIKEKVKGEKLIGKYCVAPGIERKIIILPSKFCNPNIGTGLVTSVPSHAPFDWMGIYDLQQNPKECEKYGLNVEEVKQIEPISLIKVPGYKLHPAVEICEKLEIKSQNEAKALEQAKKDIYKLEHHHGVMKENCGPYKGMSVDQAKKAIKKDLSEEKKIDFLYEMTGKVVCRCLTDCIIKVVSDQWFLEYSDPKWKKITHECLDQLKLYPEKARKQFDYVLDWLREWACTREFGLGTKLPWDDKWVIESLSDSTIQMAYCTIAKYLKAPKEYGIDTDKLNDNFFEFIFQNNGKIEDIAKETGIKTELLETMQKEFNYWYPFDYRNSAKDLIQNHLAFCLFNHTALFPKKQWPKAYVLNGRVMINNEKMSKSKGNFFTIRELYQKHGADVIRLTAANAGEGIDDANFDMNFLQTADHKLNEIHQFCKENYNKGRAEKRKIDEWFESVIKISIKRTTDSLDSMLLKSAVNAGLMDMQRHLKWYTRRTQGNYNKETISFFIETQLKLLTPFTPFFCEETWQAIGKETYISNETWPVVTKVDPMAENAELLIEQTMQDINQVRKLAKIEKPTSVTLFVAAQWKYAFFSKVKELLEKTREFKEIMSNIMQDEALKPYSKDISKILPKLIKAGSIDEVAKRNEEIATIKDALEFLSQEFNCNVNLDESEKHPKAKSAMPSKVGISLE